MGVASIRRSLGARPAATLAVAAVCSFIFLELMGEVLEGKVAPFDIAISRWMRSWASPSADAVMWFFTRMGSYFVTCCVVTCVAAWAAWRKARGLALELVAVTVVAIALNAVLKNAFDRPRPDLYPDVVLPDTWSFPSGHSMVSLAAYGTAAFVIGRLYPPARVAALVLVALAVPMIGASRVYLGVHWPSDVAAGFAAGALLLVATRAAVSRRR